MRQHSRLLLGIVISLLGAVHGCTPHYPNEPLQTYDPRAGYRAHNLAPGAHNTDKVLVMVSFSGGGTRAAALAHGVLQGLRDIELPGGTPGDQRSLLDEVDAISSVSGGSFTALAYGLWGEDIFGGHYEQRFLRHNVQGDLVLMALNPINLLTGANKSDLAARYYDKHIFKHATYGDLLTRGRPMINVNATEMARQEQFHFIQNDFDLLGSDLSKLPVAWAAASSSAVPVVLDPLRFKYWHGDAMDAAIRVRLTTKIPQFHPFYELWALDLIDRKAFEESDVIDVAEQDHKYMYLLDGGLVDNLGITPFFTAFSDGGIRYLLKEGKIDHLVMIIVDAGTAPPNDIERSASTPGGLTSLLTTATSGLHTNTWLLKAFARALYLRAIPEAKRAYELCDPGQVQDRAPEYAIDIYVADLNFASLEDYDERQRFLNLPTSFALDDEDIDALIAVGRQLVKDNSELQRLLQNLGS